MRTEIAIDESLKAAAPRLALGIVETSVHVAAKNDALWEAVAIRANELKDALKIEELPGIPQIKALREAYRTIGKDPARCRASQEALLRRILKGQPLYQINTVVDVNTLMSLRSFHSVGSYDSSRLTGGIVFRIGRPGEAYKGIGKDVISVSDLPVFADQLGPFGSPTSDSERAMIMSGTRNLIMVMIAFTGSEGLAEQLESASSFLTTYCGPLEAAPQTRVVE